MKQTTGVLYIISTKVLLEKITVSLRVRRDGRFTKGKMGVDWVTDKAIERR